MRGTSLEDLQNRVGQWAARTFTRSTNVTIVTHLEREVRELLAEVEEEVRLPGGPRNTQRIAEEAADCAMLLLHLCERNRIDLAHHIKRKFAVNQQREWGVEDAEGVKSHIGG